MISDIKRKLNEMSQSSQIEEIFKFLFGKTHSVDIIKCDHCTYFHLIITSTYLKLQKNKKKKSMFKLVFNYKYFIDHM